MKTSRMYFGKSYLPKWTVVGFDIANWVLSGVAVITGVRERSELGIIYNAKHISMYWDTSEWTGWLNDFECTKLKATAITTH